MGSQVSVYSIRGLELATTTMQIVSWGDRDVEPKVITWCYVIQYGQTWGSLGTQRMTPNPARHLGKVEKLCWEGY